MSINLDQIKAEISDVGLKATHQRIVIYDYLMKSKTHPTVDRIYDDVKNHIPSVSVATIYRVLEDFVTAGLIYKVATREGTMRYDANTAPHNHIYCTNTQDIIDYNDQELNDLIANFLSKKKIKNFKISDIKLQINGEKLDPDDSVSIN
ncbi:MAG: transcriptional repressor [bacterium]|nr:transcriptional repressor [bacterium]